MRGLSESSLKNYRQIVLTWPRLAIRQTLSGDLMSLLPPAAEVALPWQDDAWMERLCRELSFSQLLELSWADLPLEHALGAVRAEGIGAHLAFTAG